MSSAALSKVEPALPPSPSDGAGSLFELIGQSPLIEQRQAMLVSIAPVKAALGARWDARRTQIYDLVERYFLKHLAPADICHRIGETRFLVATPDQPPYVAQAVCYRALKEVLTYFLGEVQSRDVDVCVVTHLSADRVGVEPCTVADLERAEAQAAPARAGGPGREPSPVSALVSWPLKTADGQDLRVSFAVDPVMDLRAWAVAGHRIESRIVRLASGAELTSAQRRSLLPRDFERIDMAALERGLSRLNDAEMLHKPTLIVQLSFASLSNSRARAALLDQAKDQQEMLYRAAICELIDVENGIPSGRLTEVASLIRGFFRSVWVQVEPQRTVVEAACAAKVAGITVRAADLGRDAEEVADGMRRFVPMVKRANALVTVTSLPSSELLIEALSAGFTHATLRSQPPAPSLTPAKRAVVLDCD